MIEKRDIDFVLEYPIEWGKFRSKTILVTGATGRLGMYIVETLSKANIDWNLNITILIMARNGEKIRGLFNKSLDLPYIHTIVQDIVQPIIWEGNIDYIFHTAGLASPMDFTTRPIETLWGHVQGTRNVLELAREKKVKKVCYVSTVEIYGEFLSKNEICEDDMGIIKCDNARACYPEAKRLCETMLACYEKAYNIQYVTIRLCHTFGPGITLDDGRAFSEFLRSAIAGKDIVLESDGSAVRTYTYVTDAIGAMFIAFTKGKDKSYNVANLNNLISIRDLAKLIASLNPNRVVSVKYADGEKQELKYLPFKLPIMDVTKIKKLGWKPRVDIKDAFRYTMESFLQES